VDEISVLTDGGRRALLGDGGQGHGEDEGAGDDSFFKFFSSSSSSSSSQYLLA
jgi:hypothetical protein